MNCIAKIILVPVLALAGWAAVPRAGGQEGGAPAAPERYQALQKEFNETARGLWESKSDEERRAVAERAVKLSPQFLELAEKNPDSAVALDSLVQVVVQELWLVNNTLHPGRGKGTASLEDRAVALLLQHHLQNPALGSACQRLSYGFGKSCETFLRTVLAKTPHKEVQGLACFRLAQFLNGRMKRLDLLKIKPEMARRYEGIFGKEYLDEMERMDRAKALQEVEALFERAAQEFGDVKLPYDVLVRTTANLELHEIRHLSVGREALEIESEDQDGVRFKLSDYRGKKVVLLYFWSEY